MTVLEKIDKEKVPSHVAIIMDGNGRWAQKRGEHRVFGHISGVEAVREALTAAGEAGVKYLTLYAFSTENWNRPKEEVDALMDLLVRTISAEVESLNENQVKLETIGDIEHLPEGAKEALAKAKKDTSHNKRVTLILALSYSSRWEIVNAVKEIAHDIEENKLNANEINEQVFSSYLATKNYPDPELMIRTSGETRLSNFLLWQLAYTEFYFIGIFWPDFKKENFYEAILDYQERERRFGKTSGQLEAND